MNGLPYYKAYPRDFIEGTIGMSFELKGAYRLLLDLIYMQAGRLPDDPRYISGLLGCSVRAWKKYRATLVSDGKIYAENGIISNFRADKELETLSKLQEVKRENRSGGNKNKDLAKRPSDHTEPEPDIEKEDTKVSSKNKRGTRLADDWFLPDAWGKWAVSEGWPAEVVRDQAERFKDYWCAAPGQKGVKLDWQATWRNWMRNSNAKKMGYANGERNHINKTDPAIEQIARLAGLSQASGDGGC